MVTVALAAFLAIHGLIHAAYLSPVPAPRPGAPSWPFHLDRSWMLMGVGLSNRAVRTIGVALVAAVLAGFATASAGLLLEQPWWQPVAAASAALSLVQLSLYFHRWLVAGLAIDVVIAAAVLAPVST